MGNLTVVVNYGDGSNESIYLGEDLSILLADGLRLNHSGAVTFCNVDRKKYLRNINGKTCYRTNNGYDYVCLVCLI
jgi:hypothetical protein